MDPMDLQWTIDMRRGESSSRATTPANAREAVARFVEGNANRLREWLDEVAEKEGPVAAFRCFMDVIEYHVPKLARTERTGHVGGPVVTALDRLDQAL